MSHAAEGHAAVRALRRGSAEVHAFVPDRLRVIVQERRDVKIRCFAANIPQPTFVVVSERRVQAFSFAIDHAEDPHLLKSREAKEALEGERHSTVAHHLKPVLAVDASEDALLGAQRHAEQEVSWRSRLRSLGLKAPSGPRPAAEVERERNRRGTRPFDVLTELPGVSQVTGPLVARLGGLLEEVREAHSKQISGRSEAKDNGKLTATPYEDGDFKPGPLQVGPICHTGRY